MKASGIGGQAVMEGIMMKNGENYAVAIRKPDNEIIVKQDVDHSYQKHEKIRKIPFIRGMFNFIDSLVLGMSTLTYSAEFYEEEEEPTKLDLFLARILGGFGEKVVMGMTVALSIILAVAIFMVCPFLLAKLFERVIVSQLVLSLVEGVIRVGILLGYIGLISRIEDIQRVFMYHGAEHKCINCIEHGMELTVENVMKSSKEHKRCGTSFLLVVMFVSIIFFLFIRVDSTWMRLGLRILLVPFIAGVSYEFIRLAGNSESKLVNILSKPGMLLQGLTTKEPDESMVEVAIKAVEAVFDWRAFLEEYATENGGKNTANAKDKTAKVETTDKKSTDVKTEDSKENLSEKMDAAINKEESSVDKSAILQKAVAEQKNALQNVLKKSVETEQTVGNILNKNMENTQEISGKENLLKKNATETTEKQNETGKSVEEVAQKNIEATTKDVSETVAAKTMTSTDEKTVQTSQEIQPEEKVIPEYGVREKKEPETKTVVTSSITEDNGIKAPRLTFVDDTESGVIKLHWDKVKKVSGYVVYRKAEDEVYKMYPEVKKNYFEDTEVEPGVTYYYRVRAYVLKNGKRVYGQLSPVESNGFNARVKSKY